MVKMANTMAMKKIRQMQLPNNFIHLRKYSGMMQLEKMQKIFFSLLFLLGTSHVFSQTVEDIESQFSKGELDKAKASVDAYLVKDKNQGKPEGWWYKGVVYNEIAKSEKYRNLSADGRMESFNAFKKYYELDTKNVRGMLEQNVRMFDLYNGYFDLAADQFSKKQYDDAFTNFKNAHSVEEYINGKGFDYNGFKFPEFDTMLVTNIALSAYMAKKEDEAADYYKKIADRKIAGNENLEVYQYLVEYFDKKKDLVSREKYLQLGRELYPADDFWYLTELDDVSEKDKKALYAKYEELIRKYPGKHVLIYNYAVELFNYTYTRDAKPSNYKESQKKLETTLNQCLVAKSDYTEANVLMARHLYNVSFDIQDEMNAITGTSAADKKKKDDLKVLMQSKSDELISYAKPAHDAYMAKPELKPGENGNLKTVTDFLVSAYEVKGDKVKADEYKRKLEAMK
jgi:hypothetical protein